MSKNMAYKSRKKKKAQSFKTRFRIWGTLVLIMSIFAGLYYFSRYEPWQITMITFEGNERVDIEQIEKDIIEYLESPWWQLISKNNKFFYEKKQIADSILINYPLVETATLRVENKNNIIVTIVERGPQYVLCEEGQETVNDESESETMPCVFVDITGLAYEEMEPTVAHEGLFVFKEDIVVATPYLAFNDEEKEFFEEIKRSLRDTHSIRYIAYRPGDTTDVFLGEDFHIKFTKRNPVGEQINNIEIGLREKIQEIDFSPYKYIDARFPGKIYLYEKGEEEE